MENKRPTQGPIEAQLKAWGAELDKLKAKVDREVAEAKKEYYEHMEELRTDIETGLLKWGYEMEELKSKANVADVRKAVSELGATIKAELKEWEPEIDILRTKAARAEAEAKKMLEELRTRRKALKEELVELKGAGDAAWGDVKTGIGKAWEELKTALHSASAKFK